MGKTTNLYTSKYTSKKISASQHLAEIVCERQADKDKKGLPYKFWNLPEFKPAFMNQLRAANSLLKLYSPEAISNVLRRNPKVYSLRAAWLDSCFQAEQIKLDAAIRSANQNQIREAILTSGEARPTFSTVKNKLKGL